MAYFWGAALALATLAFAVAAGFERERGFYPLVLIVIAAYYDLFAVMQGSMPALAAESVGLVAFAAAAVAGFRWNLWIVVAALALHGVFDFAHELLVSNPGVPDWWPQFCLSYDVAAAACLAWVILSGRQPASGFNARQRTA